jgi:hypothetical protein
MFPAYDRGMAAVGRTDSSADILERVLVLREVLAKHPGLRRQARRDHGYAPRIQLGATVAAALEETLAGDMGRLPRRLGPGTADCAGSIQVDRLVRSVSFLVPGLDAPGFRGAAQDVARRWAGRLELRTLGPLLPYSVVDGPPPTGRKQRAGHERPPRPRPTPTQKVKR